MGKKNSDAQDNEKCGYSFKHRWIPEQRLCSAFCTVQEIPLSGLNFPPHDDFEQHCAPSPRTFELGLNAKK
jgi:hypothetical protein